MNKEFVPYDIALAMKELGFHEPCFGFYNDEGIFEDVIVRRIKLFPFPLAPLYQQAFRWFIEEFDFKSGFILFDYITLKLKEGLNYQEAQDACLKKLIEIVKDAK